MSEVRVYTIRVDFEDETSETTEVAAESIGEAVAIVRRDPSVVGTSVLWSTGDAELVPLAFISGTR